IVVGGDACLAPSALGVNNVNCNSAELNWVTSHSNGYSVVEYGVAGFTPGTGMKVFVQSPYSALGLQSSTTYEFYVADTCGMDTSAYAGPFSFTTDSAVVIASFVVDSVYDAGSNGVQVDFNATS